MYDNEYKTKGSKIFKPRIKLNLGNVYCSNLCIRFGT